VRQGALVEELEELGETVHAKNALQVLQQEQPLSLVHPLFRTTFGWH
jgi:hypothetical protein